MVAFVRDNEEGRDHLRRGRYAGGKAISCVDTWAEIERAKISLDRVLPDLVYCSKPLRIVPCRFSTGRDRSHPSWVRRMKQ